MTFSYFGDLLLESIGYMIGYMIGIVISPYIPIYPHNTIGKNPMMFTNLAISYLFLSVCCGQDLCGWTAWHSAAAHGQEKAGRMGKI